MMPSLIGLSTFSAAVRRPLTEAISTSPIFGALTASSTADPWRSSWKTTEYDPSAAR